MDWDDYNAGGSDIALDEHTYVNGRLGVRIEKTVKQTSGEIKPWAYVGVNHEFTDTSTVHYGSNYEFAAQDYGTAGEIRLGINADIKSGVSAYGDMGYTSNFGDYENISGNVGVKIKW